MLQAAGATERADALVVAAIMITRTSRLSMKQPTFNWTALIKSNECLNFETDVKYILMTRIYHISYSKRFPVIMN